MEEETNVKKADLQLIGYIGTILGVIFFTGGIFASNYYEVHEVWLIRYAVYPYAQYSGSLTLAGIVLLVIGLAFLWRAKQEEGEIAPPKPPD